MKADGTMVAALGSLDGIEEQDVHFLGVGPAAEWEHWVGLGTAKYNGLDIDAGRYIISVQDKVRKTESCTWNW